MSATRPTPAPLPFTEYERAMILIAAAQMEYLCILANNTPNPTYNLQHPAHAQSQRIAEFLMTQTPNAAKLIAGMK